ncbi:MAG: XylR family transcriptional regulator [Burkholderiales bacterium]|nr:XylR family transcriptional regulator [Phycisphaerae bacterium]
MPRRQMLTGVAQYIQEHEPWAVYLKPEQVSKAMSDWLQNWDGDGIIAAIHEHNSDLFAELRIPVVDIAGAIPGIKVPLVHANDSAIGKTGAEHLADRGFTNFAFCVRPDAYWSQQRREGFVAALDRRGMSCRVYEIVPLPDAGGPFGWQRQQEALVKWIRELPKPVGVMTSTDLMGQQFLEACMRAGIRVPEEVAVIAADDDKPICNVCTPIEEHGIFPAQFRIFCAQHMGRTAQVLTR